MVKTQYIPTRKPQPVIDCVFGQPPSTSSTSSPPRFHHNTSTEPPEAQISAHFKPTKPTYALHTLKEHKTYAISSQG